jgi:hypothetical protein
MHINMIELRLNIEYCNQSKQRNYNKQTTANNNPFSISTFYLIHIDNNHVEGYEVLVRERIKPREQTLMANMVPSYSKYASIGKTSWVQELHRYNGNLAIPLQCPPHVSFGNLGHIWH